MADSHPVSHLGHSAPRLGWFVIRWSSLVARAVALVALAGLIALAVGLGVSSVAKPVADSITDVTKVSLPKAPAGPQTTFVYDRNGHLITTLQGGYNRIPVPLDQMSMHVRDAVIAVEDKDYYKHGAVDSKAILRAAAEDLGHREITQGGSTIAQQYVKNVYLNDAQTLARKFREAILAIKLEQLYSKDEILERYLNTVYFGNGAYGVEAAARTYWSISASKLTVLQSATLAGVIQAPAVFDPVRHPKLTQERRNIVLHDMAQQGYITADQDARLQSKKVTLRMTKPDRSSPSNFFVQFVSGQLQDRFGVERTFSGGLRVTTTLDAGDQLAAEHAVASHLTQATDPSAALVAIDPRSGAIRAMVGGQDFTKAKFNLAVQAHRQAGSAFKPFTLTAALEREISLNSIWVGPPNLIIDDPICQTNGQPWDVSNYADESAGTMRLLDATANSVNTIFAQLVVKVGPRNVVDVAHRMGITSALQPVCSITLGSQPVSPLDMTDAYATLAARGLRHRAMAIQKVTDPSGKVLTKGPAAAKRAISTNVADLVTEALEGVIDHGTGTAANIGRPAAGKTGTAQNFQDAWFCGYTPQLAACVWVGYPKTEDRPMHDVEGFPDVFGGSIPALIWHDFMTSAMKGQPVQGFANPPIPGASTFESAPSLSPPPPPPSPSPKPHPSHSPKPKPTPPGDPSASPSSGAVGDSGQTAVTGAVVVGPLGMALVAAALARRRRSRRRRPRITPPPEPIC